MTGHKLFRPGSSALSFSFRKWEPTFFRVAASVWFLCGIVRPHKPYSGWTTGESHGSWLRFRRVISSNSADRRRSTDRGTRSFPERIRGSRRFFPDFSFSGPFGQVRPVGFSNGRVFFGGYPKGSQKENRQNREPPRDYWFGEVWQRRPCNLLRATQFSHGLQQPSGARRSSPKRAQTRQTLVEVQGQRKAQGALRLVRAACTNRA